MTRRRLMTFAPIGLGVVLLLGGAGCATKADLGEMNRGFIQKIESLDSTVHAQAEELRGELETAQATHSKEYEELKAALESLKADVATANMVTEYWSETMQGLKEITAWTEHVTQRFETVQQLRAAVDHLPSLLTGLTTEVRSLRQALVNTYTLEAAALRERLKALEQIQRQLEDSPQGSAVGKTTAQ